MNCKRDSHNRSGFSMTEVILALLVIAIGMMAVIGLFPASLDQSKKAIDETYATFFAESVFASLKSAQTYVPWGELDTYEHIPPNTISNPNGSNPGQAVMWSNPDDMRVVADGNIHSIVFDARLSNGAESMRDHAHSYRLTMTTSAANERIYEVTLELWNNEFVENITPAPDPEMVFYTELFNYGL